MFSVVGKKVIVTGGSRGIGAEDVRCLVDHGAHVAIFDILDAQGRELAREVSRFGPGKASYFHVDISNRSEVFEAVSIALKELGGLDSLHNCAGVERAASAEDITEEDFDLILKINVKGTFFAAQAAFPHLKTNGGSIINFGSDNGLSPYVNGIHYSASKGAVHSLTRTLAHEWGKHKIRVNAVLPAVWTEMYEEHRQRYTEEALLEHDFIQQKRIPLGGKLGSPSEELAPVILFLTSDASKFITAQLIPVNGGADWVR